jgi:hypothetical protein|tara:strand:+ start:1829 stop:2047 length:219 start_codon:yes stop_codon:yes gene_type:complete
MIRKVSIGLDVKSNAMHYITNQKVVDGSYTIHLIKREMNGNICIWIQKNDIIVLWKEFNSSMPMSIEYNLDF